MLQCNSTIKNGLDVVKANNSDVLISVGGGSTIDTAKGISILKASAGDLIAYAIPRGGRGIMEKRSLPGETITHIAIPTTAGSASEVMPTAGIRDPETKEKLLFWDPKIVPTAAILDPELAIYAGPTLTASTGMTAMARCVEAVYSAQRNSISNGLAIHAMRLLYKSLSLSVVEPENVQARGDCQQAALMSGVAAINAMVSFIHAFGHVAGGLYGLQHGLVHTILLPPAMQLLLPSVGKDQKFLLEALGIDNDLSEFNGSKLASDLMFELIESLPLPKNLCELGIEQNKLSELAANTMEDYMMFYSPRPIKKSEIIAILESVW